MMKKDRFDEWYFKEYPEHKKLKRIGVTKAIAELNVAEQEYFDKKLVVENLKDFMRCYQAALAAWKDRNKRRKI